MKIKKTLFSVEIETTPDELRRFREVLPTFMLGGFLLWLKQNFNLDLLPPPTKKESK